MRRSFRTDLAPLGSVTTIGSTAWHCCFGTTTPLAEATAVVLGCTVPGEHVPVDLVKAAIGEGALEPAPVGRVVGIEPAFPGGVVGGQVETARFAGRCIPSGPSTGVAVEKAPGLLIRQIPADRRSRLIAMKAARIGDARVAHGGPAGRIGQRIGARRNGR